MPIDPLVARHYELHDEAERLWSPGSGTLTRLRTWELFARHLPAAGLVVDVGGGPGTHARHLAARGYDVVLVDPLAKHVEQAAGGGFASRLGDARALPLPDAAADAVLLLGPLYHLVRPADRRQALAEAVRVLRPGGVLLAEAITRHAWIVDATRKRLLADQRVWDEFAVNLSTGLSNAPDKVGDGVFWGYFHHVDELRAEVTDAGLADVRLVAVEGFAGVLDDLADLLAEPEPLLRAIRLTETELSMLGVSPHVIAIGRKPAQTD